VAVHRRSPIQSENLQWNSHDGDRLLRESITEAGLKSGPRSLEKVGSAILRTQLKNLKSLRSEMRRNATLDTGKSRLKDGYPCSKADQFGNTKVLVALGGQAYKILSYMKRLGLSAHQWKRSIIIRMSCFGLRPEQGSGLTIRIAFQNSNQASHTSPRNMMPNTHMETDALILRCASAQLLKRVARHVRYAR